MFAFYLDPDPELTRLSTIPAFYPIMRGSLNIPTSSRDPDLLEKLDPKNLLLLCLRYQEHLKQLSESVAFDQNALCIRIKEVREFFNTCIPSLLDQGSISRGESEKVYIKKEALRPFLLSPLDMVCLSITKFNFDLNMEYFH